MVGVNKQNHLNESTFELGYIPVKPLSLIKRIRLNII